MSTKGQTINDLLEQLRHAGQHPRPELLTSIANLGAEAVPALIALVTDPAAYNMSEDPEDVSYWAPYPAVEMLGKLHPPEALDPLLTLITWDDYDYLAEIVPEALAQYGSVALDRLGSILTDQGQTVWTRVRAISALREMARLYPELRDQIVAQMTAQLDVDEPDNDLLDTLRGFLISELVQLEAEESVPSIIRAFESTWIDPYLVSWSDVRRKLGVPPDIAPHLDEIAPRRGSPFNSLLGSPAPGTGREEPSTYRRAAPKVGRNDPCPCGSGKKYKKCHGR